MAEIQGIEYEIKGSADSAVSSLDKLASTLGKIKSATSGGLGLTNIAGEIKVFGNTAKGIENIDPSKISLIGASLRAFSKIRLSNRLTKGMTKLAESLVPLTTAIGGISQFSNTLKDLGDPKRSEQMSKGFATLRDYLKEISQIDFSNLVDGANALRELQRAVNGSNNASKEKDTSLWKKFTGAIRSVTKSKLGKFALSNLTAPFRNATKSVAGFVGKIKETISGFKRILGYRLIRTLIKKIGDAFKQGTQNLYAYSSAIGGSFAANMDDAATSMLYFKNSVGAAWAPLMNFLAPAIRVVTDAAVELLNVINQLIALLTGQSGWTRAIRNATEYGDAVGGAGGKAKEALKYLAPFDELNVLPDDKNGGGGGGSALDYGSMFEEVTEFESGIAGFAERIKEAFRNSDWKGLGTLLGDKVNELIDMVDFTGIGSKVGESINALFTTKYWTLDAINFQNIGAKVAQLFTGEEGIGGALRKIDFKTIGASLVQDVLILPDVVIGFLRDLDWGEVAKALSDTISGAWGKASNWLSGIDWGELGSTFATKLIDLVKGINYVEVAKSFGTLFKSALTAEMKFFTGFLDTLGVTKWLNDNIVQPLTDAFEKIKQIYRFLFPEQASKSEQADWYNQRIGFEGRANRGEYQRGSFYGGVGGGGKGTYNVLNASINVMRRLGVNSSKPFAVGFSTGLSREMASKSIDINSQANITAFVDKLPDSGKVLDTTAKLTGNPINSLASKVLQFSADIVGKPNDKLESKNLSFIADIVSWFRSFTKDPEINSSANLTQWERLFTKDPDINSKANLALWEKTFNGDPAIKSKANLDAWTQRFTDTPEISTKATFKSWVRGFADTPDIDSRAKIVELNNSIGTPTLKTKADFNDWIQSFAKPQIKADAKIDKVITPNGQFTLTQNAGGGIFVNGHWNPIQQFASGGTASFGQLFIARERGPELVGSLGGHTAVMNNDQIVASVSAGVARAIASIRFQMSGLDMTFAVPESQGIDEDAMYRAFRRALDETDFGPDEIDLDGDAVYRSMVRRNRQNTRMTGVNAFA